jgi:hypothetical protein
VTRILPLVVAVLAAPVYGHAAEHDFSLQAPAEVVASIKASCASCDWGRRGREASFLEVTLDGVYSQHVLVII